VAVFLSDWTHTATSALAGRRSIAAEIPISRDNRKVFKSPAVNERPAVKAGRFLFDIQ
jgi:hypothetical protein